MRQNKVSSKITMLSCIWEYIKDQGNSMLKCKAKTSKALEFQMKMEINLWTNVSGKKKKKVIAFRQDLTLTTSSII